MKYGVISDSHDNINNIRKAMAIFKERGTETVIHLGDYCAGPAVRSMKGGPKVLGILGNNDGDVLSIRRGFEWIGGELKGQFYVFENDGAKIACYHGTVAEIVEALIDCGHYDIVLSGHTHEVREVRRGKTYALNPGSAHGFDDKATIAILDTAKREAEIINL